MYHLLMRTKDSPLDWIIAKADKRREGNTDNIYMVASSYYIDRINGVKEE